MDNSKRILVVDDDESIRDSVAAILKEEGYSVDSAASGSEAIEKSKKEFYNVALIDIRLPDMEGTEVLAKMRDTSPKIRKIIMTGFPSVQNAILAVNRRADAYLVKPVEIEQLLSTIRGQLKLQEDEKNFTELKVAEFIETRVKEMKKN